MDDDPLIPVFMPSLIATLLNAEKRKGRPLTYEEVMEIRDQSTCVMMKTSQVRSIDASRGHDDINSENCWEEYLRVRSGLSEAGPK
jgi:hypothetical protein